MKITGAQALKLRIKLGINQSDFWKVLGVTQSGGSRYESGRNMPVPVQKLYWLVYVRDIVPNLSMKQVKDFGAVGK